MPKPPSDNDRPNGDDFPKKRPFSKGDRPFNKEKRSFGDKPRSFGDKPRSFRRDGEGGGDRPRSFGDKPRSFGDKPRGFRRDGEGGGDRPRSFGDKPRSFGDKPRTFRRDGEGGGDRPRSFGDKPRSFGDKPRGFRRDGEGGGDRPRSFGDKPRSFGDKPRTFRRDGEGDGDRPRSFGFGDKPRGFRRDGEGGGDRPRSFGDKPRSFGDKPRSFRRDGEGGGDRPRSFGDKPRSFGDKPRTFRRDGEGGGDRPRSFGDKPRSFGDKPRTFRRDGEGGGDRPRSFGDKPRSFGDKPRSFRRDGEGGGDRPRSFGDKPRSFGDKPRTFRRDGEGGGDRPRSFGDKPRSFGDKPRTFRRDGEGGGDRPRSFGDKPRSFGDKPRSFGDKPRTFGDRPPRAEGEVPESRGHMNHRALMQLGAELLFDFRHGGQPADRAIADYMSDRRFLGARDRAFISDWFFHVLRHLRRFDEAIRAAFDGFPMSKESFRTGFPVTSDSGVRAWQEGSASEREGLRQDFTARATDTMRIALAAHQLGQVSIEDIVTELEKCWPFKPTKPAALQPPKDAEKEEKVEKPEDGEEAKPSRTPRPGGIPTTGAIQRMFERAVEMVEMYGADKRPTNQSRRWSFPDWLWAQLWQGRSEDELDSLGASLLVQGGLTLRVNTIRSTRDEVLAMLQAIEIEARTSPLASEALVLGQRLSRDTVPGMTDGLVEIQDEGSQAVGHYCGVEPGWVVADACAGGGGKSLHLAALMNNTGRIHAFDIDPARLNPIEKRAERCGVTIIDRTLTLSALGTLPLVSQLNNVDLVLIDAPCSGTGTLRRQPEIRWRLTSARLAELRATQQDLLEKWASRVRVGGYLVYATCSLLELENWLQVEAFLKKHSEFELAPPEGFPAHGLTPRGELSLAPHKHGCDGFYAARLRRVR